MKNDTRVIGKTLAECPNFLFRTQQRTFKTLSVVSSFFSASKFLGTYLCVKLYGSPLSLLLQEDVFATCILHTRAPVTG